ncbi:MAG TPA: hypothetical protein VFQ35_24780, partial [Polyangiaceae bacterium]|nr:hypothetical protein [Polyangiaceae bacterium]
MAQASSATLVGNLDAIQEASEFALFEQNLVYETLHAPLVRTDGISSRTVVKRLHRNALVRRLNYVVSAGRAAAALLANAGQVRLQESTPGLTQVVVDFGVPRTVASVGALDATGGPELKILSVSVWDGAKFLKTAHYSASWAQAYQNGTVVDIVTASDPSTAKMAIFPEVRTERLLLVLVGEADAVAVSNNVWVRLPDAPTDLELRLDGAVVWSAPGPAEPN